MTLPLLLSVIGEPGVGKSTTVRWMWKSLGVTDSVEYSPRPAVTIMQRLDREGHLVGVELGRDRAGFPGSDSLSMAALPACADYLPELATELVVAEGDRLASPRFYAAAHRAGRRVLVVWLKSPTAAAERRAGRGSVQAESWLAGRRTKVLRLAADSGAVVLGADQPPPYLGAALANMARSVLNA